MLKLTAFDRPPTVGSLTKEEVLPKGNNLMILGYMRGGSSMSGQVFRDSEDDFYVYEPLIKYAPYQYLTESRFCEMESLKCRCVSVADPGFLERGFICIKVLGSFC